MSDNITKGREAKIPPKIGFSKTELAKVEKYFTTKGPQPLPPQVCEKLFDSYMNGSSLSDICRMYSEYDPDAIHYSAYHYDWPLRRDDLAIDLQERIKQKILHSKYQQLELVDSMIKVAHIEAMQAFQAYIKHPNDKNMPKTFRIKTIKELSTAIDMMSQIVGQDNMKKLEIIKKEKDSDEEETSKRGRGSGGPELTEKSAKELISSLNKVHDNEKA